MRGKSDLNKTALITGITGQDGSYLSEFLLDKGYEVYGLIRRSSSPNLSRIAHISDRVKLLSGDLTDQTSLDGALRMAEPDEIYNLAAQSFVATSWNQPTLTADINGVGFVRLLEAVRHSGREIRVYQASSSEMFGMVEESPQNEDTKFHPRSPYACAKAFSHHTAVNYRESYNMFVCSGILFNHESPRRGLEFVTRKITDGVARIYHQRASKLMLGNLEVKRDWGYAGDYVRAMWLMLQQDKPEDFVIATGENHTVKEFAKLAFEQVGLDWKKYVAVDPQFFRPAEVTQLCGDASKAKRVLGWKPEVGFQQLVTMMVEADMERVARQIHHSSP
ncbi:MAG: GDP-mannose 4,6-dehydratase [Dehalococcoidales bacterium]|nr:GDP-mannose 4,6-dehydratase [Dehalococcoidales bacterium]